MVAAQEHKILQKNRGFYNVIVYKFLMQFVLIVSFTDRYLISFNMYVVHVCCNKPHSNVWLTIGLACDIFRLST